MSKKLNITNFKEVGETLGATKIKETESSYVFIYDVKQFPKEIVVDDKTSGELLTVNKMFILIDKEIDFDTNPKKPLTKVTFIFIDSFNDPLDTVSYLVAPADIKERLLSLLNLLKNGNA